MIVPVNNGGLEFVKCMLCLLDASPAPGEIIVVSDGDEDNSWREAQKPGVRVIREPVSGGPAKARNRGAGEATGDILLFIDADVAVPPGLIGQVTEIFRREPDLAAVIGSYDDEPGAGDFFSRYKNLFHHFTHQQANSQASTFWGACGAIRREIFLAAGGFDENYRKPCIEDIELGYRLTAAGHRIKLVKSLQVKHLKRWGWLSLLKADFFQRALPWTRAHPARPALHQRSQLANLKPYQRADELRHFGRAGWSGSVAPAFDCRGFVSAPAAFTQLKAFSVLQKKMGLVVCRQSVRLALSLFFVQWIGLRHRNGKTLIPSGKSALTNRVRQQNLRWGVAWEGDHLGGQSLSH